MFLETHRKKEIWEEVTKCAWVSKSYFIHFYNVGLPGLSIMICKMRGP